MHYSPCHHNHTIVSTISCRDATGGDMAYSCARWYKTPLWRQWDGDTLEHLTWSRWVYVTHKCHRPWEQGEDLSYRSRHMYEWVVLGGRLGGDRQHKPTSKNCPWVIFIFSAISRNLMGNSHGGKAKTAIHTGSDQAGSLEGDLKQLLLLLRNFYFKV